MASSDGEDATEEGVDRAHKSEKKRKTAEDIHRPFVDPLHQRQAKLTSGAKALRSPGLNVGTEAPTS